MTGVTRPCAVGYITWRLPNRALTVTQAGAELLGAARARVGFAMARSDCGFRPRDVQVSLRDDPILLAL